MNPKNKENKATQSIHAGRNPDDQYGSLAPPIYQTSTFIFNSTDQGAARFAGTEKGFIYTRMGNPTTQMLEEKIGLLENGCGALATSSGMAAISTVYFTFLAAGAHVIGTDALYGPSRLIIEDEFARYRVDSDFIDTSNPDRILSALRPETKMLFIETPTNPTLAMTDIATAAEIARENKLILVVDNTFMTPLLQRPLELGADVVVHSATKFLNGHTDVVGGFIAAKDQSLLDSLSSRLRNLGGTMDPHQAWMILRGSQTLALRVEKAQKNAMELAKRLEAIPAVSRVLYPGLESHPQHELAKSQMDGFGALLSFELAGGYAAAVKLLNSVHTCTLAVSLGGLETLIQHPASMTHASVPKQVRENVGISDGLIRLSVGCEDVEDILKDFEEF